MSTFDLAQKTIFIHMYLFEVQPGYLKEDFPHESSLKMAPHNVQIMKKKKKKFLRAK